MADQTGIYIIPHLCSVDVELNVMTNRLWLFSEGLRLVVVKVTMVITATMMMSCTGPWIERPEQDTHPQ